MSSESLPIPPARFAAALKDLSVASLNLKTLELRNNLVHLAYSNAQLRPFADGSATALNGTQGQPDPDCVEAIRENEAVMGRMRERIELVKAEVEERGLSWREFEGKDEVDETEPGVAVNGEEGPSGSAPSVNGGVNGRGTDQDRGATTAASPSGTVPARSNPWEDGTFQTGVIRNGEVHMDPAPGQRSVAGAGAASSGHGSMSGGRLTDEELRRMLEDRLAEDDDEEENGGLHL